MKLVVYRDTTGREYPVQDWPTALAWICSHPDELWSIRRKGAVPPGQVAFAFLNPDREVVAYIQESDLRPTRDQTLLDRLWNGDPTC